MNKVTKAQAQQVLKLVEQKYAAWLDGAPDSYRPHLFEDWDGEGHWAVVWESGSPYEWALASLTDEVTDEEYGFKLPGVGPMPAGVLTEPYYSFVLVLYPDGYHGWQS